jgi:biotin carboxyl carrier protein
MTSERAGELFALLEALKQTRFGEVRLEMPGFKFHAVRYSRLDSPAVITADPGTEKEFRRIRAPRLGIFRSAEAPGAPVKVVPGQRVQEEDVVGYIQVLEKTFPVPSRIQGIIERNYVADGQMVEFNQCLFLVGGKERI